MTLDDARPSAEEAANQERSAIARRASVVGLGTLFSRVLGLAREQVLAAVFTRAATDVFFVAFLIPNVLRQLLAEGAIQSGVIPVMTEVREREGDAAARRLFRALRGLSIVLLGATSALGVVFAPWLVELFAGGFKEFPGKFERTVVVTRWVFPYIFFMGSAALGIAALNTQRRFAVAAFAPALLNVAFIVAALTLPSAMLALGQDPLLALAIGVLIGGALQVAAQWPALRKIGYLELPSIEWNHPAVREVFRRMTPVLFGFGVYYVDVVVARHLLSTLGQGAPSYFTFAQRLCDFPQGIFVMALQTATLPTLSSLAAKGNTTELVRTFQHSLRLALFVAIPASVGLALLAEPAVLLLFERGEFTRLDTIETAKSLAVQSAGIWAIACVRQLTIVFFALGDTRTPVIVSALDFVVFASAAFLLQGPYGHVGVAAAVSVASVAQTILLLVALRRRLGPLQLRSLLFASLKTGVCAVVAAVLARQTGAALLPGADAGQWLRLVPGVAAAFVFLACFSLLAHVLRVDEFRQLTSAVLTRLSRRRRFRK